MAIKDYEPMLEENSDEVLLEETTDCEALLEEESGASALSVLQSCSREDIELYGISIISIAKGRNPRLYYRGYTFEYVDNIAKINSFSDVNSILHIFDEIRVNKFIDVNDSQLKDFEKYWNENSDILANAFNIITYCSESDFLKLLRTKKNASFNFEHRIVQEMQLIPLCMGDSVDVGYSIDYQHQYCDAQIGGGIVEIMQSGFIGGHRDSINSEYVHIKLSSFESFTYLLLGAWIQYCILDHKWKDDIVLLSVLPFEINAEIWINGRYRDGLKLIESQTTIPAKVSRMIVDDDCSVVITIASVRSEIDIRKLFGYSPKSFEITMDVTPNSSINLIVSDKESKKNISIRDLFGKMKTTINDNPEPEQGLTPEQIAHSFGVTYEIKSIKR